MIDKKDIIIDRIIPPVVYSFLLFLGNHFFYDRDWKNTIILVLISLIVLIVFAFNTAQYYMTDFQLQNDRISFDYRITISNSIKHVDIDYNSIIKFKFYSKIRILSTFNLIKIKYKTELGKSKNFSISVKDTLQRENIIAELEKQCTARV